MKKTILILFSFGNSVRLFHRFTRRLLDSGSYRLVFAASNEEIASVCREVFPGEPVESAFSPELIENAAPHLVICQEVWVGPIIPVLDAARGKNIPVLMYDHGSLLFGSYYSLEGDEYMANYRSDVTRCSHIACWGKRGKESWLKYGISDKKITITGAVHYDDLYGPRQKDKFGGLYRQLNISPRDKIILYYSAIGHASTDTQWNRREKQVLADLEKFVRDKPRFRLVVKPHPLAMRDNPRPFEHDKDTIMVCTPFEEAWDNVVKIDCDALCAMAYAAVSSVSSVLLTPLILKIPIIHIEINRGVCKNFSQFVQGAVLNLTEKESIAPVLEEIPTLFKRKRKPAYKRLTVLLNYKNDGRASERLQGLVDDVLKEQEAGKAFYTPVITEFRNCRRRSRNLPYPLQNLCLHAARTGDFRMATYYFTRYLQQFEQPRPLLKKMVDFFLSTVHEPSRITGFLRPYHEMNVLDPLHSIRLAQLYRSLGNYSRALDTLFDLQETQKNRPLIKIIFYETGLTFLLDGKKLDYARAHFQRTLGMINTPDDLKYRAYYRLGETYFKLNQPAMARKQLNRCLRLCPNHRAAASLLASLHPKKQDGAERIKQFFKEIQSINIETTNRCNMIDQHPFCPLHRRREKFGDCLLDTMVIENLFKELHRWEFSGRLGLHHYSEPLTDKRILSLIRKARRLCPGARLNIWTNGTLLTRKKAADFFIYGVQWLRISAYSDDDYKQFTQWKEHLLNQFPDREMTVERQTLDNRLELYQDPVQNLEKTCPRVYEQLVITSAGEIQLCCFDYLCSQQFGNVNTQPLTQILAESSYLDVRDDLMKGLRNKYDVCSRCRF